MPKRTTTNYYNGGNSLPFIAIKLCFNNVSVSNCLRALARECEVVCVCALRESENVRV